MKGVTQGAVGGPTTRMVVRGKVTRHRIQRNWGFRGGGARIGGHPPHLPAPDDVGYGKEQLPLGRGQGSGVWGDSQVSVRARSSEKMLGKWNVRHDRPRVPCAEVGLLDSYEKMHQPHASLASGSSAAKWRHGHLLVNDADALGRRCGPSPRSGQEALWSHLACC